MKWSTGNLPPTKFTPAKIRELKAKLAYRHRVYVVKQVAGGTLFALCAAATLTLLAFMLLATGG